MDDLLSSEHFAMKRDNVILPFSGNIFFCSSEKYAIQADAQNVADSS